MSASHDEVLGWVAAATGSRHATRGARIQSLWSGYGELFRVSLDDGPIETCVVKWARPPDHERGSASDERKRRSYQVETRFYREVARQCDEACRVARLLAARERDGEWVLVLEDLDAAGFPARQRRLDGRPLEACLRWLASFHATFMGAAPEGLWASGTYWHLATRREELACIDDPDLRGIAAEVDRELDAGRFRTLLHGDAKEANFCFTPRGDAVAAVDFQYAGGGCGMKDVAYLLHGRDDEPDDERASPRLDVYFLTLREALGRRGARVDVAALEAEWRRLYPLARVDFCRFLAGWAPSHWRGDMRAQRFVRRWMAERRASC